MSGIYAGAIEPERPECTLCSDTGLQYLPDYPPVYRFCACAKGIEKQMSEPEAVRDANAGWQQIQKVGAK